MRKKILFFILFVLMITGIAVGIHDYFHWQVMLTTETFTESTEKIWNPNRGFYHIYGFLISDEPADMSEQLDRQMQKDTDHALAMAQINLREYRDKEISKEGLQNIERLFQAIRGARRLRYSSSFPFHSASRGGACCQSSVSSRWGKCPWPSMA